jgi:hypothetical protein
MIIGANHKKQNESYFYWYLLAIIFVFLSIDETAVIHEKLWKPLHLSLETTGLFYYAWVIPYGIVSILIPLFFFKFLRSLSPRTLFPYFPDPIIKKSYWIYRSHTGFFH